MWERGLERKLVGVLQLSGWKRFWGKIEKLQIWKGYDEDEGAERVCQQICQTISSKTVPVEFLDWWNGGEVTETQNTKSLAALTTAKLSVFLECESHQAIVVPHTKQRLLNSSNS